MLYFLGIVDSILMILKHNTVALKLSCQKDLTEIGVQIVDMTSLMRSFLIIKDSGIALDRGTMVAGSTDFEQEKWRRWYRKGDWFEKLGVFLSLPNKPAKSWRRRRIIFGRNSTSIGSYGT
jgi:hypothetical protein